MLMNSRWARQGVTARHYLLALYGCLVVWLPDEVLPLAWWHGEHQHQGQQQQQPPHLGHCHRKSVETAGDKGRVLTIIPLISLHYYQYNRSETLGQAWGQSQNKTASVFFNNKTLQWITKYYFKNNFTNSCWQEQIWCHFNFHWNNIWKINFIR